MTKVGAVPATDAKNLKVVMKFLEVTRVTNFETYTPELKILLTVSLESLQDGTSIHGHDAMMKIVGDEFVAAWNEFYKGTQ